MLRFLVMLRWLIAFWHIAEPDAKAVPRVDRREGQGQIGRFFIGKMRAHLLIDLVWHVIERDQGELLFLPPEAYHDNGLVKRAIFSYIRGAI